MVLCLHYADLDILFDLDVFHYFFLNLHLSVFIWPSQFSGAHLHFGARQVAQSPALGLALGGQLPPVLPSLPKELGEGPGRGHWGAWPSACARPRGFLTCSQVLLLLLGKNRAHPAWCFLCGGLITTCG